MPNYTSVLCDTHFALCPPGNHVDTWRLTEALDCGAIPIISSGEQAHYYEQLMPSVAAHFIVLHITCTKPWNFCPTLAASRTQQRDTDCSPLLS